MDPELKEYLDAWSARRQREFDAILDALHRPATELRAADPDSFTATVDTSGGDGPVQASSGTTELVNTSVGLYEPPATTPIIEESLAVTPAVPVDTTSGAPATYSTECPRRDANESTPVSTPAAPPTSPMVTVSVIPVLTAAAASDGTFDDEAINGAASMTITSSSGSPHSGVSASTDVGVVLPAAQVCIPGASTRPWLEPVPPRPPDPWSLFPGAWYRSRPGACITVQPAIKAVLWCNDTEEVPTYVLSDEVPQHDEVQRQPWPPPPEFCEDPLCNELKEILGNAASFGLQHCSSNGPRATTLATLESQRLQLLDLLEGANQLKCTKRAQGLTRELLVEAGIRQNFEAKQSDTTRGIFLDHHRRSGSVILGVLVTWLHFSRIQILALAFKETSFQTDPMSLQEFIGTSYCYLHFGAAQNLGTLVCCAWEILGLLSGGSYCVGYFWMTWDPGLTSYRIIIFCCHEKSDYCSLLWALEKEKQVSEIMLQSDRAEIYQLLTQSGEYLPLCLQPKPPWSTKIDIEDEEGGVHPHREEITYVQPMLTSSPLTLTEYSDRELFRPSPRPTFWPSFMDVHADGDETWPLPWPSFREVNSRDRESPSGGIRKASQWFSFDSSPPKIVVVSESQFPHCCYGSSDSSYGLPFYAILDAYCWPGYFVTWEFSEIASADFKDNLLTDVDEEIIQANFMVVCYWACGAVAWSVCTTRFRPTEACTLLDARKHTNSKQSSQTLILACPEITAVIGFDLCSQFGTTIMLIWSSQFVALLSGGEQGSTFHKLSRALLSVRHRVNYTQWSWDPGGCTFALCNYEKKWTTPVDCHEQFQWSSRQPPHAFRIWLVAWIVNGLEFSMCRGHASKEGGMSSELTSLTKPISATTTTSSLSTRFSSATPTTLTESAATSSTTVKTSTTTPTRPRKATCHGIPASQSFDIN